MPDHACAGNVQDRVAGRRPNDAEPTVSITCAKTPSRIPPLAQPETGMIRRCREAAMNARSRSIEGA